MNNNQQTYNLLDKPWIQCVFHNKDTKNIGLIEFNQNINKITDIVVPKIAGSDFPFYELAFYRFAIVLYSRALNCSPWDDRDATIGLSDDEINMMEQYLMAHKDRFDIMDSQYPFMQCTLSDLSAASIETAPSAINFVTSFVHLPSENAINTNTLLGYDFNIERGAVNKKDNSKIIVEHIANLAASTTREAVYHLLYLNAFAKCAGVAGCSSISSTPELYVLFQGETVGQTIKMNLVVNAEEQSKPMWERDGVLSYYQIAEPIDTIGYTFYPNRFCRFEWNEHGMTDKMLYAPHNFKTLNDTSKNICRGTCEQYYQSCDRDALIKMIDDKNIALKYNRTENWLTMLMSAVINADEIPESSLAGRDVFGGSIELPAHMKIVLYGRSADGKSGVYKYAEKLEESVDSAIFSDPNKRSYIEKYIKLVREQFVISKKVVDKYYKLQNKVNAHVENKVPFINQCISLYAHKRINDVYHSLESEIDIDENMERIMKGVRSYTRNTILEMLSENVLCAAHAYNAIVFGGKK